MIKKINTHGFRDLKFDFAAFHSVWCWNKHVPVDQLHHSGCYTWTPGHTLGLCLSGRSWRGRPWSQVSQPWPLTFIWVIKLILCFDLYICLHGRRHQELEVLRAKLAPNFLKHDPDHFLYLQLDHFVTRQTLESGLFVRHIHNIFVIILLMMTVG